MPNNLKSMQNLGYLVFAVVLFAIVYEHYPRLGWVDASIYNSYVIGDDSYQYVDGFTVALNGATYQFSRLGHIIPLRILGDFVGNVEARRLYNFLLFTAFCTAAIKLTIACVSNSGGRVLVLGFILLNPQFISAIVFGGADGPAAIYSFISLVTLFFAARKRSGLLFLLAGIWFGLAFSAHIFALIPYFMVLIALCFGIRLVGFKDLKSYAQYLLLFVLGLASVILVLSVFGNYLGLHQNYLVYSLGRIQASAQGYGISFSPPLDFWKQNASLWVGVVLLLICSLIFDFRGVLNGQNQNSSSRKVAIFCFLFPLIFVVFFDFLIGGSLIASPHYFNAFLPSFGIGVVHLISSWNKSTGSLLRYLSYLAVVFISFGAAILLPNNYALFSFNEIRSKNNLLSQQSLETEVSRLIEKKIFNLVYSNSDQGGREGGMYVDYFMGKKRLFDYVDSLAYTFPWVGDKMHRVNLRDPSGMDIKLEKELPTIVLSSTEIRLDETLGVIRASLGVHAIKTRICGGYEPYQWCMVIIEHG